MIINWKVSLRHRKIEEHLIDTTLLISIGKLKPTIGMITYRNTCALDSKGKIAYKLILNLLPVIFLCKCSSNSNYFGY